MFDGISDQVEQAYSESQNLQREMTVSDDVTSMLRVIAPVFLLSATLSATPADDSVPTAPTAVWWNKDYMKEIGSIPDCTTALRSWRPKGYAPGDYYTVEMTMPDNSIRECRTVSEWLDARTKGGYAHTTVAMVMESHFSERLAAYSVIPHLLPATRSRFKPEEWSHDARHLISSDDKCLHGKRLTYSEVKWELEPNRCSYENEDEFEISRVLARGDYDGDGSEDLLVFNAGGYKHGSLRFFNTRLFTRRPSGRMVETSARLLDAVNDPATIAKHRRDLANSFGLPEKVPIKLEGQLGDDDHAARIEAELVFVDGFVSGTYQYSRIGKPIPVEGTLGTLNRIEFAEFALDEQPNARFRLTWKVEGDQLVLEGWWTEAIQCQDVRLAGPLGNSKPSPSPTANQARSPRG